MRKFQLIALSHVRFEDTVKTKMRKCFVIAIDVNNLPIIFNANVNKVFLMMQTCKFLQKFESFDGISFYTIAWEYFVEKTT